MEAPFCSSYFVGMISGVLAYVPFPFNTSLAFPGVHRRDVWQFLCLIDKIDTTTAKDKRTHLILATNTTKCCGGQLALSSNMLCEL